MTDAQLILEFTTVKPEYKTLTEHVAKRGHWPPSTKCFEIHLEVLVRQRQRLTSFLALGLVVAALVASGCIPHQNMWHYRVDTYQPAPQPLTEKRLVVPSFKDSRPDKNTDASALVYVPGIPYGFLDYSLPEAATVFPMEPPSRGAPQQFKPKDDLASAAAEELRASGIFKEVVGVSPACEGDLVLYGEVKSTRYYATMLTYGLSVVAPALWFIGIPAGSITNELRVEFSLEDSRTRTELWRKTYEEVYKATYWMPYYYPPQFKYPTLYKTMLRDVVERLRNEFTSHP